MAEGVWKIVEIGSDAGGMQLRIPAPSSIHPHPGQYFLTFTADLIESRSTPLFFAGADRASWTLAGKFPGYWQPGWELCWRGPYGKGFHLPVKAERVSLVSWKLPPSGLLPLIGLALRQKASVVWCSDHLPADLPPEVEVLSPESLAVALEWSDYLALECSRENLPQLTALLTQHTYRRAEIFVELLVRTPLSCGGMADCGVCAVKGKSGWKLACKDGPVFSVADLEVPGG